jgi:hypothetical protein
LTKIKLFEAIIKNLSTKTLIPQLPSKERWEILLDTLRGMPLFRSGRTRDFPFSEQRDNACKLAGIFSQQLLTVVPGQNKKTAKFNLYDYLSAISIIDIASQSHESNKYCFNDDYFTYSIIYLIDVVFDEAQDKLRACILLGIDSFTFNTQYRKAKKDNTKLFSRSATLAVIADFHKNNNENDEFKIEQVAALYEIHRSKFRALEHLKISLLYIKTRNVQKFLDGCLSHFILRGASFWCSQVLSITRDIICKELSSNCRIFTDSDSVVIIAINKEIDENKIKQLVVNNLTNKSIILENYPRLIEHYQAALNEQVNIQNILPDLGISLSNQKSVLKLATDNCCVEFFNIKRWNENNTISFSTENENIDKGQRCSGYLGEKAFVDQRFISPSWYNQQNIGEAYGWKSSLFSLADISFRQQFLIELQAWLQNYLDFHPNYCTYSKNISKAIGLKSNEEDKISFLKIDGDSVGKYFTEQPSICRPRASICVEENIKYRCLHSVKSLIKKYSLEHIPLDLVYFGGDDLFITIPSFLVLDFIDAFIENKPIESALHNDIEYTFASIKLKNVKYKDKTIDHDLLQREASRLLNPLLEIAKEYYKNNLTSLEQIEMNNLSSKGRSLMKEHVNDFEFVGNPALHGISLELKYEESNSQRI